MLTPLHFVGDVSLSAEDKPPGPPNTAASRNQNVPNPPPVYGDDEDDDGFEEDDLPGWLEGHTALKFLFAGGVAGAGESSSTSYRRI